MGARVSTFKNRSNEIMEIRAWIPSDRPDHFRSIARIEPGGVQKIPFRSLCLEKKDTVLDPENQPSLMVFMGSRFIFLDPAAVAAERAKITCDIDTAGQPSVYYSRRFRLRMPRFSTSASGLRKKPHDRMVNQSPSDRQLEQEYERRVSEVPEDDQTIEVRDQIFHDMMGQDTHGYYRMYERTVPRGVVYNKDSGLSQASSSSTTVKISKEMEQRLTAKIEKRVTEKLMIEFQWMKDQMILFQCQGSINTNKQVPDAFSMQRLFRESVGDDIIRDEVAGDDVNDLQQLVFLRQPSPPQLDRHVVLKD